MTSTPRMSFAYFHLAVAALACGLAVPAFAQATFDGCKDAKGNPVASTVDESLTDLAKASMTPDGKPVIRYNPKILPQLSPPTRLFFFAHECAHFSRGDAVDASRTLERERNADCAGLRMLVHEQRVTDDGIVAIRRDLKNSTKEDWTHLPGPRRDIELLACLGKGVLPPGRSLAPSVAPTYCCDMYGSPRCVISVERGPVGAACSCNDAPGRGRSC
jgi:hypothetical protein